MKIKTGIDKTNNISYWIIYCPACKKRHQFRSDLWSFNGNFNNPTFRPSLIIETENPKTKCHLVVTDGYLYFEKDCSHDMANLSVPLPDLNRE